MEHDDIADRRVCVFVGLFVGEDAVAGSDRREPRGGRDAEGLEQTAPDVQGVTYAAALDHHADEHVDGGVDADEHVDGGVVVRLWRVVHSRPSGQPTRVNGGRDHDAEQGSDHEKREDDRGGRVH
jgi:hypothetical protein